MPQSAIRRDAPATAIAAPSTELARGKKTKTRTPKGLEISVAATSLNTTKLFKNRIPPRKPEPKADAKRAEMAALPAFWHESNSAADLKLVNVVHSPRPGGVIKNRLIQTAIELGVPAKKRDKFVKGLSKLLLDAGVFLNEPAKKLQLPEDAPSVYADRAQGQDVFEYLLAADGWGPYVKAGVLTQPALLDLDPNAYGALRYWIRNHGEILPFDIKIPSKQDLMKSDGPSEEEARAAARLTRRYDRRKHLRSEP